MPSRFLSKGLILAIHRDLIETFGGSPGIRDDALFDSALAQPQVTAGGGLLHPTVFDQAAAYLFHLCSNHPFVDGNKRVAFAAMDTFLRLNGYRLDLTDEESYDLTVGVATSEVGKNQVAKLIRRRAARA